MGDGARARVALTSPGPGARASVNFSAAAYRATMDVLFRVLFSRQYTPRDQRVLDAIRRFNSPAMGLFAVQRSLPLFRHIPTAIAKRIMADIAVMDEYARQLVEERRSMRRRGEQLPQDLLTELVRVAAAAAAGADRGGEC